MGGDRPRTVPPPPTRYGSVPALQTRPAPQARPMAPPRPAIPAPPGAPPGVAQPFKGAIGGAVLGGAYGFTAAGPLGFVGGALLGGAVIGSLMHWWNIPVGNQDGQPQDNRSRGNGSRSNRSKGNRTGTHPTQTTRNPKGSTTATAGASRTSTASTRPSRPRPPPRCNENDVLDEEDIDAAFAIINNQNQTLRDALSVAKTLTATYKANCDAYDFDRKKSYIPANHGGSVHLNIGYGRTQNYNNRERYFPAGGAPYKEIDVNAGVGVAGNYRMIQADSPVGGYQEWVGYNITHHGVHWIRVWNQAGRYWQDWNSTTHTASDLPGHVTGARPVDPRTPEQRKLVSEGIRVKRIVAKQFQRKIMADTVI